ncbi:flagellar basal body-associated protein FliL [Campylobacter sp. 19-13652]|uniref:flagellar basal body-associated protein FliL n=1 Tax=Campylobacter sp. 19-13652 TaxID=2840180 RepID=UPI001C79265B|nr:flagellar basal body-associated protein FliL [Campylobacter sp. 19-13652]BCX79493.1 flagellar basal body protein FliL [Campylobacter sp. 19-13652]
MAEETVTEEKKSNKSLLLIVIIAIFVLLIIVGAIVFVLLGSDPAPDEVTKSSEVAAKQVSKPAQPQQGRRSVDYLNMGPMYPLDQFIVNLLSENGSRFLKTKIDLEQSNEELAAELDKKKALLRDIIIRTLSSKTYEEVSTAKGKDRLKDEIVNRLNEVLSDGYIKNIFFTDFVVQ